jgi:hypothetical protein
MAPDGWEFVYVESSEGGEPGTGGMPGIGGGDEPEGPTITPDPEPSEPSDTYVISFSTIGSKQLTVNNVDVTNQVVETGIGVDGTISCKYETTEVIRQASFKDNTDLVRVFSLDSSNILDMSEMFDGCTSFFGIVSYIDCGAVTNMSYMFRNCTSLSMIQTGYLTNNHNVTNMTGMYYNCSSMTDIAEAQYYWENGAVTEYADCFYNCTSLNNYSEIPASWGGPSDSE